MAGYDHYDDSNGVRWTIIQTNNGFTYLATVLDEADPKYDPPAEDQIVSMAQGGLQVAGVDIIHTDPPTADQQATLFQELGQKIEAYARAHRPLVTLQVTAQPPRKGGGWWLVLLVGVALIARRR